MPGSWVDNLSVAGWLAAVAAAGFFSLRYMTRFQAQVQRNRQAGSYDDPGFRRRIRPLNFQRWGVVAGELLLVIPAIGASMVGVAPAIWISAFLVLFIPVFIWSLVVERRWRRLMTKGIELTAKADR
jgi:hypothetical protein